MLWIKWNKAFKNQTKNLRSKNPKPYCESTQKTLHMMHKSWKSVHNCGRSAVNKEKRQHYIELFYGNFLSAQFSIVLLHPCDVLTCDILAKIRLNYFEILRWKFEIVCNLFLNYMKSWIYSYINFTPYFLLYWPNTIIFTLRTLRR